MNEILPVHPLEKLFKEKQSLLSAFLEVTQDYRDRFKDASAEADASVSVETKMDWVDELSDVREGHFRAIQALDLAIEQEKRQLHSHDLEILQGLDSFKATLEETLSLIREIQLTDQSLFLYIQSMGFELRAQILKGLKEKEALSKFKSQAQNATGEGLDHTV